MIAPRDVARTLCGAFVGDAELGPVEDDHNDNEWRAGDGGQAVNFHVKTGDRDFLVTVEDVTYAETGIEL